MNTRRFKLELVEYMPGALVDGVLYVSIPYQTAAHRCACGCGEKIRTQLGPMGWEFSNDKCGPTLDPSIGNWQKPCRSHYFIRDGLVIWASDMSNAAIERGRQAENRRRDIHIQVQQQSLWRKFERWWNSSS
jgi:hypothetical protein